MRPSQKAIQFLFWCGMGLTTPVMSLIFLDRGCTLQTLPLVMGLYAATVVFCEVPSGIFADLFGRKRTYLASCALYCGSLLLLYLAHSVWALLPAAVFQGLGRAFASGSLDALFVEDAVERLGPERLSLAASQLSLCQCSGLAAGALVGGVLPDMGGYALHLGLRVLLLLVPALLCAASVHEPKGRGTGRAPSLSAHLCACAGLLRRAPMLWGLLACLLTTGALVSAVETYWQPAFLALAGDRLRPALGVLSAAAFGATIVGNLLVRRAKLAGPEREWRAYFLLRFAAAGAAALFALRPGAARFAAGYLLFYLLLGGTDVLEQTLLNRLAPDEQRSSLLSVGSLTAQAGGVLVSLFSAAAVGAVGFGGVFLACALAWAAGTLVPMALNRPNASTSFDSGPPAG